MPESQIFHQENRYPAKIFDLAIAWNWEFDRDFIYKINSDCLACGLRPYLIDPFNLDETLRLLNDKRLVFLYFFDRASDTDSRFFELVQVLLQREVFFLNHPEKIKWIDDKVLIHMDFIFNDISVAPTFIYYPTDEKRVILNKIKQIGVPFVVKPAHSVETGGAGVLLNARSLEDVCQWHSRYKNFIFLLQKQIAPVLMDTRPAWFRVFFIMGRIIPLWWNPSTHVYNLVTKREVNKFQLAPLRRLAEKISKIYKLEFFSTEIAVENGGNFVVVDYINDQCDMRKKSIYADGVCDEAIDSITSRIAGTIKKSLSNKKSDSFALTGVLNSISDKVKHKVLSPDLETPQIA